MTESEFKKLLDAAEKSPREIAAAVSGLPEKVLKYKPAPEKWSILEILAHLVDMETLYAYRMRQIIADKNPVLAPIDQDDWARNLGYMDENPAELVALYGLNRHHNVGLLKRLKPGDLDKCAMHPELSKQVPLWDYVQKMGVHGPNHLRQIEQLKREAVKTKSA
jgi:hypothetical protein